MANDTKLSCEATRYYVAVTSGMEVAPSTATEVTLTYEGISIEISKDAFPSEILKALVTEAKKHGQELAGKLSKPTMVFNPEDESITKQ